MNRAKKSSTKKSRTLLDLTIHGGLGGGRWSMFGDFTRQSLYNRDRGNGNRDPVADLKSYGRQGPEVGSQGGPQFVKAGLKRNCRNTRNIAEHTAMIAGFETPPFKPGAESGIDVDYRYWGSSSRWQDLLAETIEDLTKKDKLAAADITVLTPGRIERDALRDDRADRRSPARRLRAETRGLNDRASRSPRSTLSRAWKVQS